MAVKVADTVKPLSTFFVAEGEDVSLTKPNGTQKSLQAMYNDGELGTDGIQMDDEMSDESEHPVKNKIIKGYVDEYAGKINTVYESTSNTLIFKGARGGGGGQGTFDYNELANKPQVNGVELEGTKSISDLRLISSDADNSLKLGTDGKLYATGGGKITDIDTEMSDTSTNVVENKVIKKYVDDNVVTVDSQMSLSSENPVQNKVVREYVDRYAGKIDTEYDQPQNTLIFKGARTGGAELTEEHLTGETYFGKPVYEKIVNLTSGSSVNTSKKLGVTITSLGIDKVLDIKGVYDRDGSGFIPVNHISSTTDLSNLWFAYSDSQLTELHNNSAYNSVPMIITIKYTKK